MKLDIIINNNVTHYILNYTFDKKLGTKGYIWHDNSLRYLKKIIQIDLIFIKK